MDNFQSHLKLGSVHGRFQPFHNGHLEYALAAKQKCDHLFVGITQHQISDLKWSGVRTAEHRSQSDSNPLTYLQRSELIKLALLDNGVSSSDFTITPFPIETPTELVSYISLNTKAFTTVYDDWNRDKIRMLRLVGYEVDVLWERSEKRYEGKRVRRSLRAKDDSWRKDVPAACHRLLETYLEAFGEQTR